MPDRTCTAEDCERGGRLRQGLCDMHYQRWQRANGIQHVSDRKCSVEGCGAPHKANGLCGMHYARLLRTGDLGPGGKKNLPAPAECTVDGCSKVPAAKGLCAMHKSRVRAHGDVNANPFRPRGQCEVTGCDRPHEARGYCNAHYWMWRQHGEPEPGGYHFAHFKVYRLRGRAAEHTCQKCGGPAQEWAYDHEDASERLDPKRGPYSVDPGHYMPLCVRCHRAFDAAERETADEQVPQAGIHPGGRRPADGGRPGAGVVRR